jgi:hypothetical protein
VKDFNPTDTTVEEIHEMICDSAATVANYLIANDMSLPKKWRGGPVIRNSSPYNEGRLVLEITEEYSGASEKVKKIYRKHAHDALKGSIVHHGEVFAGMIFAEARAGRNYFDNWQQAPTTLF